MKLLKFIVTGQQIRRDPLCDFSGLVAGSRGYLLARFHFSAAWAGCKKVAVFVCKGEEFPAPLKNNECEIPAEALAGRVVKVYVIGRKPGVELTTDEAAFRQSAAH